MFVRFEVSLEELQNAFSYLSKKNTFLKSAIKHFSVYNNSSQWPFCEVSSQKASILNIFMRTVATKF
jgi:hypothetical protein